MSAADMTPGSMIGDRHRVVRLLGKGGMGAVYEAENTWTRRHVAIKVLLPVFSSDPTAVARFMGEAQAATILAHPNIVDVLDMGKDPTSGALYIVQEFLRGRDLHDHLEERRQLSPSQAAEILVPLMGALALAHERNIIHRDLKPENIFLVTAGSETVPKLIDFGLSKVLGEDAASRKTVTGTIMGTPYYMSPEQCRGDRAVDARTDIWAMGAVLFEMVTGRLAFEAETATLIMLKILQGPPPRVLDVAPKVPREVAAIIHRAMEPDLALRYQTLREMLNDIVACPAFQDPDRQATLRERFARSIEHRPPVDTAPEGSAATMMAVPAKPDAAARASAPSAPPGESHASLDSWQSRRAPSVATPPPSRRVVPAIAGVIALVGLSAAVFWFQQTPPVAAPPAASLHAVVRPPPPPVVAPPVAATLVDAGLPPAAPVAAAAPTPIEAAIADAPAQPSRHHRRHRRAESDLLAPVAPR